MKPKILQKPDTYHFAGYNYLGLAQEKRVINAMYESALQYGISPTSSRWGSGWFQIFEDFEIALKKHYGTEDATLFGAAFLGGSIYFNSLKHDFDTVYCDETCHVNLFKGMIIGGMNVIKYKHLDANHLHELLQKHKGKRPIIATDGVWGISGDIPPLKEISDIAKKYEAELFIDDAHGVFAFGEHSRGVAEYCGLKPEDATILGSMSKAMGCGGGFLVGREELVNKFRRNEITSGSSSATMPIVAASLKALELIQTEPERKAKMNANAKFMRDVLLRKGFATANQVSPIIGICLKDEFEAQRLSDHFAKNKIVMPYFKYASEPRHNLLRGAARSNFTDYELNLFEKAVQSF